MLTYDPALAWVSGEFLSLIPHNQGVIFPSAFFFCFFMLSHFPFHPSLVERTLMAHSLLLVQISRGFCFAA